MSWEATSLLLLAAALVAGFAWYERSRPPSQVVALVAALAALSVAGRLAFDPVPNVVPTTDITLFTGYALGGPPGFAVGALSALVSNLWLGQGPWTPWQMVAWGACGLLGAALARASHRRLGRYGLAAACGFAGVAYGALLDLSVMVTYGGEQSWDRYLALSVRGIPFNLAHAAGNVAIALVAGPALVRMLERFRSRFEARWSKAPPAARAGAGGLAGLLVALTVALSLASPGGSAHAGSVSAGPGAAASGGQSRALGWLQRAQNDDGGYGVSPDSSSSAGMTGWAVLGLEGAGRNPLDLRRRGRTPVEYLRSTAGSVRTTGDMERTILALRGAGLDPRGFAGQDLVSRLRGRRSGDGSFSHQINLTAFGVFALKAAGTPGAGRAAAWLRRQQNGDGGWGFSTAASSDADSTGAALQALAVSRGSSGALRRGVHYLRGAQRPGGGWSLSGGSVNAQSTAWAIQGLVAAGVSPGWVRTGGRSPLDYLASLRAGDGHYRYSSSSDQTPVWVTAQALMAVGGEAFPVEPVPRRPTGAVRGGPGGGASAPGAAANTAGAKATKKSSGAGSAGADPGPAAAGAAAGTEQDAPAAAESEPASARVDAEASGALSWAVPAGVLVLLAATWLGWLRYRRRLP